MLRVAVEGPSCLCSSPCLPRGVATPADAALCMQLGVDGVFVGSGIFKSDEPEKRAAARVQRAFEARKAPRLAERVLRSVHRWAGSALFGSFVGGPMPLAARWTLRAKAA